MANIFLVSHILLLFHSPKGSWNKSAKYEKLGKYWPYCTPNRAITNAYTHPRKHNIRAVKNLQVFCNFVLSKHSKNRTLLNATERHGTPCRPYFSVLITKPRVILQFLTTIGLMFYLNDDVSKPLGLKAYILQESLKLNGSA